MARGKLRLYLGAAPGVGKTFAMLNEGWRRHERGTDVVVGLVETHGRANTAAQVRDLEVVPRRRIEYRGRSFEEMDTEAVLARHPQVALVDELAHTNVPGSRHEKRWQDVEDLLEAGIDVISTVNLQHLESVNDVVERITGVSQRETLPDAFVREADQIELVDMAPEAIRRRLAHGNIYPPDRIDAAMANFFRAGNLAALRELALLWVADRVDDELQSYRERHGISGSWETRERVVVSLTGAPGADALVRRAARMAGRTKAELVGVHVLGDAAPGGGEGLARHRALLEELGGRFVEVVGTDVAKALVEVARAENATQLVLGASRRGRWREILGGSVVNGALRAAGGSIDVHVIGTEGEAAPLRRRAGRLRSPLPRRRAVLAVAAGVVGFPALTAVLVAVRGSLHGDLSLPFACYLLLVMAVAAVGGLWPAVAGAAAGFLLLNFDFAPPLHTFTIADSRDVSALVAFVVVAVVVAVLVDLAARRSTAAARATSDARALARAAGRLAPGAGDPLPAVLDDLRTTFRQDGVAVVRARGDAFEVVHRSGRRVPVRREEATVTVPLAGDQQLVAAGPPLSADDREILAGFAAQLAAALEADRLRRQAATADDLGRRTQLLSALVAAVSHDLRTPLAAIRAAAGRLRDDGAATGEARALTDTVDAEAARLADMVDNLLDLSRLRGGGLAVTTGPTDVGAVVTDTLRGLGIRAARVQVRLAPDLPPADADPALLARALASLVDNALVHGRATGGRPDEVRVEAAPVGGAVHLRVVDRGPGVPAAQRPAALHLLETDGVGPVSGLGLPVARGFVTAMGGELQLEDTPGGGCTALVTLPVAARSGPGPRAAATPVG